RAGAGGGGWGGYGALQGAGHGGGWGVGGRWETGAAEAVRRLHAGDERGAETGRPCPALQSVLTRDTQRSMARHAPMQTVIHGWQRPRSEERGPPQPHRLPGSGVPQLASSSIAPWVRERRGGAAPAVAVSEPGCHRTHGHGSVHAWSWTMDCLCPHRGETHELFHPPRGPSGKRLPRRCDSSQRGL